MSPFLTPRRTYHLASGTPVGPLCRGWFAVNSPHQVTSFEPERVDCPECLALMAERTEEAS